jgi:hypothetical protein
MADKPWSVAFAGTGETSEDNVKALLNDWLPEKLEHITVPERIGRSSKGLKRTREWLAEEVGEKHLSEAPVDGLVDVLLEHRAERADVYLVYVPAEEWDEGSDEAKLVRACILADIPVKDLTAGLDDFEPPEQEAEKPAETPAARRRGTPRSSAPEDGGEAAATAEEAVEAAKETVRNALHGIGIDPPAAPGVTVTLSQATIDALLAAFAALAGDVKAAVQAELPGAKPKTYPFWVNDDGEYRPRVGRGRPKSGEQKADLTVADIDKLGLDVPA